MKFLERHRVGIKWKEFWTLTFVSSSAEFCIFNHNKSLHVLYFHWPCFDCVQPAYGATLIEHSLMEVGLPGSVKVDSDVAQGAVEQFEFS